MLSSYSGARSPPRSRQKPGSACDECRRRKLRCDRKQPKCGVCSESGIVCNITAVGPPRGPKRGHLKALQTRIDVLESRLVEQQSAPIPLELGGNITPSPVPNGTPTTKQSPAQLNTLDSEAEITSDEEHPQAPPSVLSSAIDPLDPCTGLNKRIALKTLSSDSISDLMRADLDQLYFDRVHLFAPILHRRRYRSWARKSNKSISQTCLQYAMWTLATSLSAHFQDIRHALYTDCRQMLEAMDLEDEGSDSNDIEQAQAWILVTMYEFVRMNHRRGWTSAGRAFRLVQLMRLYEIDNSNHVPMLQNGTTQMDWVETEERRRTFWMAYSLDRFVCVRSGSPLTLHEQVISTRLPAPEMAFQSDGPVLTGFLSEVMGAIDAVHHSSFTEFIVLATIGGRSISHMQQSTVERLYGHVSQDFWDRHQWLDTIITQRIQTLSLQYLFPSEQVDPVLLFTHMFAHAAFLLLTKIIEAMSRETGDYQSTVIEYSNRSSSAAHEIVYLAKALSQLSCFKVRGSRSKALAVSLLSAFCLLQAQAHPLTPIPLFLGAEYFMTHGNGDGAFDSQLHAISEALRDLRSINNLAQEYLHLVEHYRAETMSRVADDRAQ